MNSDVLVGSRKPYEEYRKDILDTTRGQME
jgi:hypothetical protein